MTAPGHLRAAYDAALAGYLLAGGETQLRAAYELGRSAVERQVGVLELADLHHDALVGALAGRRGPGETERLLRAAGDFFREALSAYEMVQRGFREARQAALAEHRHAAMVRQLSNVLADRSLALGTEQDLLEVAVLLAEQARELLGADACCVAVSTTGRPGTVLAASHPGGAAWAALEKAAGALVHAVPAHARALRLDGDETPRHRTLRDLAARLPGGPERAWLIAPLSGLTGVRQGAIQAVGAPGQDFGDLDEEVFVHLAQMASAAFERAGWFRTTNA